MDKRASLNGAIYIGEIYLSSISNFLKQIVLKTLTNLDKHPRSLWNLQLQIFSCDVITNLFPTQETFST